MNNNQVKNKKIVTPLKSPMKGSVVIPSDKSISHRAAIFSALSHGENEIINFSSGKDCHSTLSVLKNLGVEVNFLSHNHLILKSPKEFVSPRCILDVGNSGTTIRLMSGILARQKFSCDITGDESLKKRPMARVIKPLELMGASVSSVNNCAPLSFEPAELVGIDYKSPLSSAQVKSCVMLAALGANGKTTIEEPYLSRNHTELMLKYMGADIECDGAKIAINPSELAPRTIEVAGDISSAAFFIGAGLLIEGSDIILKNVGLNPTRTGILDVLLKMGASIEVLDEQTKSGELVGDLRIKYSKLKATTIEGADIPRLIDEIPLLAVVATQATGKTIIKDAQDLRNKESDRISAVALELSKMGVEITQTHDGMIIEGVQSLKGGATIETYHDHRIAMSMYVAGLLASEPIQINEFGWVDISFPEFEYLMESLQK